MSTTTILFYLSLMKETLVKMLITFYVCVCVWYAQIYLYVEIGKGKRFLYAGKMTCTYKTLYTYFTW